MGVSDDGTFFGFALGGGGVAHREGGATSGRGQALSLTGAVHMLSGAVSLNRILVGEIEGSCKPFLKNQPQRQP